MRNLQRKHEWGNKEKSQWKKKKGAKGPPGEIRAENSTTLSGGRKRDEVPGPDELQRSKRQEGKLINKGSQ